MTAKLVQAAFGERRGAAAEYGEGEGGGVGGRGEGGAPGALGRSRGDSGGSKQV